MNTRKLLSVLMLTGALATQATAGEDLTLATASAGGSYYPVGVAMASIVTDNLAAKGIRLSPITTAGSAENVDLIRDNEAQLAIMMGLYGRDGYTGTGTRANKPRVRNLRSVAALWQNYEQFVVRKNKVLSGNLSDLGSLGSQFAWGPRNSGTEGTTKLVLNSIGVDIKNDFLPVNMKYEGAADAFQNHRLDGLSASGGIPTSAVSQLYVTSANDLQMLEVTDDQLKQIRIISGDLFTRAVIPAGTYQGQATDIRTMKQPNFLAVSADVSEDAVYRITKVMFENLDKLQAAHGAAASIRLDTVLDGLPVPLHPGALRYFEERGLDIPDSLRP